VDTSRFEFSLTVPRDPQFASTVGRLAAQAARYAGCGDAESETFSSSVEKAVRGCLGSACPDGPISVVVHRDAGPVEVLVDGRAITVEP